MLASKTIKKLTAFNMAVGILRVRNFKDVTEKAVNLTKDKKILNQKRKVLVRVEEEINAIVNLTHVILDKVDRFDIQKVKAGHSMKLIQSIPEKTTNPEILGLYILFLVFQDNIDERTDEIFAPLLSIDYMSLIIIISEEIGLEKDVADEMYELADSLKEKIGA